MLDVLQLFKRLFKPSQCQSLKLRTFRDYKIPMIQRKKPDVDIVKDVLNALLEAQPASSFVQSLSHQYEERGGLSKKQLEGLHKKALNVKTMPVSWLATLEAVILKRPTRYKSTAPAPKPFYEEKDTKHGEMIEAILAKYPQHKRVLYFQAKYNNNEALSPADITELERFNKILK